MSELATTNPFYTLALKLQRDPRFMAYVLAAYRQQENLSGDDELAETLGTLPELVVRLALCHRPVASAPQFAEQVRELADYTLTDEAQLAGILRQVEGLEKLTALTVVSPEAATQTETQAGLMLPAVLAAARDREEESDGPAEMSEQPPVEDSPADE